MTPKTLTALTAVLLLAALACGTTEDPEIRVGGPIPEFSLPLLDGGEVSNQTLAGRPAVINFWATWCRPCLKEIPALNTLATDSELRVVGIALDENGADAVRPFVKEHGIGYTVALGNEEVFSRFQGFAIPYTLVLDAESRVVSRYEGLIDLDQLERDLVRAFADPA